ncbi:MAG: hypothetical protein K8S62_02635 [Candidatus Sabulitectum sp.]|nr:hypothetical protein [Candidatus Sabulitectum sp.]
MSKAIAVVLFTIIAVMACGKDSNPSGPTGWNNGGWIGETADLIPITFSLNHPTITDWTMTVEHIYADTTDIRTWLCPSISVADDSAFSWNDTIDHDTLKYVFSFSGTFATGDSLIGLWDSSVEYNLSTGHSGVSDLGGSWTATGPE